MNDCIFCKIANGEIPSATIYEDDDFRAILDIFPASKGHALIIPKQHFKNLYEMPEEQLAKAITLAKRLGTKMEEVLECDGLNLVQNNGEAAGQTVFHFHLHLIPRYEEDSVKIEWTPNKLSEVDKAHLIEILSGE